MINLYPRSLPQGEFLVSRIREEWTRQRDPVGAVFLDALIIRCILLPAVLQMLGERTRAFPHWLDRRLPRFVLEHDGPVPAHTPVLDEGG